ncbi:MAG: (2Fe-2S)-binding protein [Hoeflea sp.]|nr:(2Fe-2S)-binding protein [Alphaproteobacteria bacterium]MBV1722433.1 (2Fe-2S)-binding protein [Hoeflea sp.]MBU4543167.1 (2Fe-2S)-binding protein [Alphaproteobacteria bacterium]MBU4550293.1 (2Fe-2S)-binding protein [Alphaproteobacteria bacterium]MBV1761583.1 (2Fe-2S)-binding protein [Hoeflea sp.]
MIVCQCNILSKAEIETAVEQLLLQDPWRLIVPSTVYHAMRMRGRCCGCFPDVVEIIGEVTARIRPEQARDAS